MSRPRVAVIGGGSAAEQFARATAGHVELTVFEPGLVGGECPFIACMPSKSMLHDARSNVSWEDAIAHRRRVTNDLDDTGHADGLRELGARLVRDRATIVDASTVRSGSDTAEFDHIIVATGAESSVPELDGIDECGPAIWTSDDVYRSTERPERIAILGGGVIGFEVADLYRHFGSEVTIIERADRSFDSISPEVEQVIVDAMRSRGVDIRYGVEAAGVQCRHTVPEDGIRLALTAGSDIDADRVVIAIGRRPRTEGIGLETLGLDPTEPLPMERNGRVRCDGSVWAMGDVAGQGQYTHLANHQASVIADHLVGTGTRTFDEVVLASCMFTSPPMFQVGSPWAELADDPDIVSVGYDLGSFPRATTDRLDPGHLWVAARRSTSTVVAASGAGPSFDELVHALVVAIDGRVPVGRLRLSMQPFPTIGEILGPIWNDLHEALGASEETSSDRAPVG